MTAVVIAALGVIVIAAGAAMIYPPAGVLVVGVALLAAGIDLARGDDVPPAPAPDDDQEGAP